MIEPGLAADPRIANLIVIAIMAVITYACRAGGYVLMGFVVITPRIKRALDALPGSIVVATVAPLVLKGGFVAFAAVTAGLLAMIFTRKEMLALGAGLGVAVGLRAAGL